MTRVIGLAQGDNLDVLSRVVLPLLDAGEWKKMGIFAADAASARRSAAYARLCQRHVPAVMAEWDVVGRGLRRDPDLAMLDRVEREIGPPSLRAGLLLDRRLFFGRAAKFRQDYEPRFSDRAQLGVLTETVGQAEALWREVQPDLVVGFVPVTLGEYVLLRLAAARRVPYLLLRSTKIGDYVTFHDRLFDLSSHIQRYFEGSAALPSGALTTARSWLERTRAQGATYEGMHPPQHASRDFHLLRAIRALGGNILEESRRRRDPQLAADPQDPGHVSWAWAMQVSQPLRAARGRRMIRRSERSVTQEDLEAKRRRPFAFFPLHFEPEVALQLYARPWQNQIEVARMLAIALPAGMDLVVKDHPRSAGMRTLGYYRKLLEIPNVRLADPMLPSHALVSRSDLVAVITGNIALEAAALRKPVVVLGETPLARLPKRMVRRVADPYTLSGELSELLRGAHQHDESALERFVASHVAAGVRAELYSALLSKGGRLSFGAGDQHSQLVALRRHLRERVADVLEHGS